MRVHVLASKFNCRLVLAEAALGIEFELQLHR
jgi:hypothetical protein